MPRRILQGTVESAKCNKTISVRVERRFRDPLYQKTVKRSTKYAAHDPEGIYKEGDKSINCLISSLLPNDQVTTSK